MSTKSFYGIGQGSFYGGGMYGNGQPPVGFIEKIIGPVSIVSFNDGLKNKPLKECIVDIDPVQDLNGYDAPWPAGGGKNKYNGQYLAVDGVFIYLFGTRSVSDIAAYGMDVKANTTYAVTIILPSTPSTAWGVYGCYTESESNIVFSQNAIGTTHTFTFTPVADTKVILWCYIAGSTTWANEGVTAQSLKIQIESGSTATSYSPYSNVCPITGWTGVKVCATGKNLVDIGDFATEYPTFCSFSDNVLSVNLNAADGSVVLYTTGIPVRVPAGSTLNWTITAGTATNPRIRFKYFDGTENDISSPIPYTISKDLVAILFNWSTRGTFTVSNFQAELGSTATAYEPFGTTHTISFPTEAGVVYGGTLDVTNGTLTVDRAMVDAGTLKWNYWIANRFYAVINGKTATKMDNVICSCYKTVLISAYEGIYNLLNEGQKTNVYITDSKYSHDAEGATALKTDLDGQQIVYELATPLTYQLTPQQITTLLGLNNVWADTGDITIKYLAKK